MKIPVPKYKIWDILYYSSTCFNNDTTPNYYIIWKVTFIKFYKCSDWYSIDYSLSDWDLYSEEFLNFYISN